MQVTEGKIRRDKTNEEKSLGDRTGSKEKHAWLQGGKVTGKVRRGEDRRISQNGDIGIILFLCIIPVSTSEKNLRQFILQRKRKEERKTYLKKND